MSNLNNTHTRASYTFQTLQTTYADLLSLGENSEFFQAILEIEEGYDAYHQIEMENFKSICSKNTLTDFQKVTSPQNPHINPELKICHISLALLEIKNPNEKLDSEEIYWKACAIAKNQASQSPTSLLSGVTVEDILPKRQVGYCDELHYEK